MTDAAPTVTPRSTAICGKSESAERTMAWLAKPATARNTMARVGRAADKRDPIGADRAPYHTARWGACEPCVPGELRDVVLPRRPGSAYPHASDGPASAAHRLAAALPHFDPRAA